MKVNEARRILGKEYESLSDLDIKKLISELEQLSFLFIKIYKSP